MILRFLARIVKYVMRLFYPFKVYGNNRLEKKGTLCLGNHQSGWDAPMFFCWTKGAQPCFMYKSDFDKVFFLKWIFRSFRCVPVKRGDADLSSVKIALDRLEKGHNICIFPEGHRNSVHNCLQNFRKGSALYALKSKCPIRIFYIWEKTKLFRKNYIIISDPFTLDEFYDKSITKALLQQVTDYLQSKMDQLRVQLNEELSNKGKKHRKYSKKELKKISEQYGEKADYYVQNTYALDKLPLPEPTLDISSQTDQSQQSTPTAE